MEKNMQELNQNEMEKATGGSGGVMGIYTCPFCGKQFDSLEEADSHFRSHSAPQAPEKK